MGQHHLLTPHEFAGYLVQWLLMIAEERKALAAAGRKALAAAIARDQAASAWERRQWERLSAVLLANPSDVVLANTVDAFLSNASSGTPHTSTVDKEVGSGVSFDAGNEASRPGFRAPPGLQSSTHSPRIFEEDWKHWDLLPPEFGGPPRGPAYYAGRARRQSDRRSRAKLNRRLARASQDAPYHCTQRR